jgi:hypothetical protein
LKYNGYVCCMYDDSLPNVSKNNHQPKIAFQSMIDQSKMSTTNLTDLFLTRTRIP